MRESTSMTSRPVSASSHAPFLLPTIKLLASSRQHGYGIFKWPDGRESGRQELPAG